MTDRRRSWVLHPWLFAAFPVLALFAGNLREGFPLRDLLVPLAWVLGAATVLVALAWVAIRDLRKAGIVASVVALLFLSYGHVRDVLGNARIGPVELGGRPFLITAAVLLAAVGVWIAVRSGPRLAGATRVLNVIAAALVGINAVTIGLAEARNRGPELAPAAEAGLESALKSARGAARQDLPDVYYLIFDRYGGARTLQDWFDYDNTPFLRALEERGFTIGSESDGNYPRTSLSLASSLNLRYLDFLTDQYGRRTGDQEPLNHLIRHPEAARIMKAGGYDYVTVGSWWYPTAASPIADLNITYGGPSEFSNTLVESSLLGSLGGGSPTHAFRRREWHRTQFQFEALSRIPQLPQPTLTFSHILLPHTPFVFREDGTYLDDDEAKQMSFRDKYLGQLRYANRRILELVDRILAAPGPRPAIILQADEGPVDAKESWEGVPTETLKRKFRILNAYELPGSGPGPYPSITPVNTFRLIIDRYLGGDLPLLADRSYVFSDVDHLYDFTEVTARIRAPD